MQLTPTSHAAAATTPAVASGTIIGHGRIRGWDPATKASVHFSADVTAGPVLRAGVRDIQATAMELIARGWNGQPRHHSGLVGFVRNGDAWDAVALLAPELPGGAIKQLWSLGELQALRVASGIQLDAIWQVSDYGGDMGWGTPRSMIPKLP